MSVLKNLVSKKAQFDTSASTTEKLQLKSNSNTLQVFYSSLVASANISYTQEHHQKWTWVKTPQNPKVILSRCP